MKANPNMDDDSDVLARIMAKAQLKSSKINLDNLRTARWNDSMRKSCVSPRFIKSPTDIFVMPHQTAVIEARILAIPDAEVKWFKDWVPITDGRRLKVRHYEPDTYILNIENVTTDDAGSYTCVARNCFGSIAHSVNIRFGHLEINECPRFLKPLESTDIIAGRKAQLEVIVTGVPKPEVKWYKNRSPLQDGGNIQICQTDQGHYVLNIYDAQSTDSGMYTCKARNDSGSVNSSAMIHVDNYDNIQNQRYRSKIPCDPVNSSAMIHLDTHRNVHNHKPRTKFPEETLPNDWSDDLSADLSRIRRQLRKLTEDFEQYEHIGLMHKKTLAKSRLPQFD